MKSESLHLGDTRVYKEALESYDGLGACISDVVGDDEIEDFISSLSDRKIAGDPLSPAAGAPRRRWSTPGNSLSTIIDGFLGDLFAETLSELVVDNVPIDSLCSREVDKLLRDEIKSYRSLEGSRVIGGMGDLEYGYRDDDVASSRSMSRRSSHATQSILLNRSESERSFSGGYYVAPESDERSRSQSHFSETQHYARSERSASIASRSSIGKHVRFEDEREEVASARRQRGLSGDGSDIEIDATVSIGGAKGKNSRKVSFAPTAAERGGSVANTGSPSPASGPSVRGAKSIGGKAYSSSEEDDDDDEEEEEEEEEIVFRTQERRLTDQAAIDEEPTPAADFRFGGSRDARPSRELVFAEAETPVSKPPGDLSNYRRVETTPSKTAQGEMVKVTANDRDGPEASPRVGSAPASVPPSPLDSAALIAADDRRHLREPQDMVRSPVAVVESSPLRHFFAQVNDRDVTADIVDISRWMSALAARVDVKQSYDPPSAEVTRELEVAMQTIGDPVKDLPERLKALGEIREATVEAARALVKQLGRQLVSGLGRQLRDTQGNVAYEACTTILRLTVTAGSIFRLIAAALVAPLAELAASGGQYFHGTQAASRLSAAASPVSRAAGNALRQLVDARDLAGSGPPAAALLDVCLELCRAVLQNPAEEAALAEMKLEDEWLRQCELEFALECFVRWMLACVSQSRAKSMPAVAARLWPKIHMIGSLLKVGDPMGADPSYRHPRPASGLSGNAATSPVARPGSSSGPTLDSLRRELGVYIRELESVARRDYTAEKAKRVGKDPHFAQQESREVGGPDCEQGREVVPVKASLGTDVGAERAAISNDIGGSTDAELRQPQAQVAGPVEYAKPSFLSGGIGELKERMMQLGLGISAAGTVAAATTQGASEVGVPEASGSVSVDHVAGPGGACGSPTAADDEAVSMAQGAEGRVAPGHVPADRAEEAFRLHGMGSAQDVAKADLAEGSAGANDATGRAQSAPSLDEIRARMQRLYGGSRVVESAIGNDAARAEPEATSSRAHAAPDATQNPVEPGTSGVGASSDTGLHFEEIRRRTAPPEAWRLPSGEAGNLRHSSVTGEPAVSGTTPTISGDELKAEIERLRASLVERRDGETQLEEALREYDATLRVVSDSGQRRELTVLREQVGKAEYQNTRLRAENRLLAKEFQELSERYDEVKGLFEKANTNVSVLKDDSQLLRAKLDMSFARYDMLRRHAEKKLYEAGEANSRLEEQLAVSESRREALVKTHNTVLAELADARKRAEEERERALAQGREVEVGFRRILELEARLEEEILGHHAALSRAKQLEKEVQSLKVAATSAGLVTQQVEIAEKKAADLTQELRRLQSENELLQEAVNAKQRTDEDQQAATQGDDVWLRAELSKTVKQAELLESAVKERDEQLSLKSKENQEMLVMLEHLLSQQEASTREPRP